MEYKLLTDFYNAVVNDTPNLSYLVTSSPLRNTNSKVASGLYMFLNGKLILRISVRRKYLLSFIRQDEG